MNDVSTLLHTDERAAYAQTASCRGTWDKLAKGQVEHRKVLKQKPDASARHFSMPTIHAYNTCLFATYFICALLSAICESDR